MTTLRAYSATQWDDVVEVHSVHIVEDKHSWPTTRTMADVTLANGGEPHRTTVDLTSGNGAAFDDGLRVKDVVEAFRAAVEPSGYALVLIYRDGETETRHFASTIDGRTDAMRALADARGNHMVRDAVVLSPSRTVVRTFAR